MIIEFIGSTGAGKSTLITKVQHELSKTTKVTSSYKLVESLIGLKNITHPTVHNIIQELVGFPFFITTIIRDRTFILFILKMLARHSKFTFNTLNYLRSIERTIGVDKILRKYGDEHLILVDEGTLIIANNIFVFTDAIYSAEEIAKFSNFAPLPDLIVYVRAPIESLITRSLQRSSPPKEMRAKNREVNKAYLERAVMMFEQLVTDEEIQSRLIVVDNPESSDKEIENTVDTITEFILNNQKKSK